MIKNLDVKLETILVHNLNNKRKIMIKGNENSNAQSWELEVTCKNKKYLNAVVKAILKYGMINFEVEVGDCHHNNPNWDGRYTVLIWCSWFGILKNLTKDLAKIEKKLDKI